MPHAHAPMLLHSHMRAEWHPSGHVMARVEQGQDAGDPLVREAVQGPPSGPTGNQGGRSLAAALPYPSPRKPIPLRPPEPALALLLTGLGLYVPQAAGVEGVMVDVWWGIVEREAPGKYDFKAYKELFQIIQKSGLKIQAVMSFHAAGGNVGDTCKIPLPAWVLDVGERDPDIFFTDRSGVRNRESLSFGADDVPVLDGHTPIEVYQVCWAAVGRQADTRAFAVAHGKALLCLPVWPQRFMEHFCDEFEDMFGDTITEITVGMGPAGELRYPAYPEGDGRWRFPGVGEFQCYDSYLLKVPGRDSLLPRVHRVWMT